MKTPFLPLLLALLPVHLLAQQATVATGGDAASAAGSVSWSVGQVAFVATSNASGSVLPGVQQPYEWLMLSAPEVEAPRLSAWPNPTTEGVHLQWDELLQGSTHYQVYNASGALVGEGPVQGNSLLIPMAHLASGSYVARVVAPAGVLHTITIQKR